MSSRKILGGNRLPDGAALFAGTTPAQRRKAKSDGLQNGEGVDIPPALHAAIEKERGRLLRADAVLGCLVIALEFDSETDLSDLPSYPYVAQIARELVNQTIDALDLVELRRQLSRNRVRESSCLITVSQTQRLKETAGAWPLLRPVPDTKRRRPDSVRLHRRDYRRRRAAATVE